MKAGAKLIIRRRMTRRKVMGPAPGIVATKAAPILLAEVKQRTPHGKPGTSTLHRSIGVRVNKRAGTATAYSNVQYAVNVEGGRKRGSRPPPVAALLPWVRRAGLPPEAAFPIARAIGRRGIKGRWMFRHGGKAAVAILRGKKVKGVSASMGGWRKRTPAR